MIERANRSSSDIRRDIEATRTEMHETVEALEQKLSVGQVVDEIWGRIRQGASGSGGSSAGDTIREHPVPLALMGLGVAWLAIDKATESEDDGRRRRHRASVGPGTDEPAEGRVGPYRGEDLGSDEPSTLHSAKEKAGSFVDKTKDKVSGAADSVKGKASDAAETARAGASSMKEKRKRASEGVTEGVARARKATAHRAGQAKRGVKRGFRTAMDEQPLALGALAFGLGLASGVATPTTRWEDHAMGGAADAVKDETKSMAKDVGKSARKVAEDTARAAREKAGKEDVTGKMKESARSIAEEAKETAEKRAHEEGIDGEGMKKRASNARDRARDRSEDR